MKDFVLSDIATIIVCCTVYPERSEGHTCTFGNSIGQFLKTKMSWKEDIIENVIDRIATGKTPPTSIKEYFDGDINWYTPSDLTNNTALNGSGRTITKKAILDKKAIIYEPGTLLITCIGNIGRLGITTKISSSNQQITGLKFKSFINPNYAFYFFLFNQTQLIQKANNAVVPILNNEGLKKIKIKYPDLKTQQEIAHVLEQADKVRQQRKAANALTDQFLQSSFLALFGDPVKNEKGWEVKIFSEIADIEKEGVQSDAIGDTNYVGLEHIEKDTGRLLEYQHTSEIDLKSTKFKFTKEHILYGKLRPYLNKVCLPEIDGVCSTDILPIKSKQGLSNKYFITYLMKQPFFIEKATSMSNGANLPRISPKTLETFQIISPPLSLQQQFAGIVAQVEELRKKQRESERELEHLFQALLQRYFGEQTSAEQEVEQPLLSIAAEPKTPFGKITSIIPPNKKGFAKYVLAGKVIKECRTKKDLTYIKIQKLQHLAEYMLEEDLHLNYYYQTAGPYDNKLMHNLANRMYRQKWFKGIESGFASMEKVDEIDNYFDRYFKERKPVFEKLMKLLSNASTAQCEIVSTLYAVWNDMLIQEIAISAEDIINRFYQWSDRKKKYKMEQLRKALDWMSEKEIVPTGFGPLIKHKKT